MKPIEFEGCNTVFGKNQKEYKPLSAYRSPLGEVVTCWSLSWRERLRLLVTGRIWWSILTFNDPIQPQLPSLYRPDFIGEENKKC